MYISAHLELTIGAKQLQYFLKWNLTNL